MDLKYKNIQEFEQKLKVQYWLAILGGVLHNAVTWLGRAALTWATVVLMGGFASDITIFDFLATTQLTILIVILLVLAASTSKLVTKKSLSTGSLQPLKLTYQDKRLLRVNLIKFMSVFLQCWVLIGALFISISEIHRPDLKILYSHAPGKLHAHDAAALPYLQACLESCATDHRIMAASDLQTRVESCFSALNGTSTSIANLRVCLFTFYNLVVLTCSVAFICNLYVLVSMLCSGSPKTLSLTRYHDEVLSRALNIGLLDADEFDTTAFLLRGVGEDLVMRKIAPLEVKRQNENFIKYLFHYPTGVEMVIGMLASEDNLLQQTAANMPGFWSSEPRGMQKQGMELLSKLGEKLGMPGKVAEGAANSFKALAVAWENVNPSPLLTVYVSRSGGRRHHNSAGVPNDASPLTSGEVGFGTLASVRGRVGEGESTNAVSTSEGGGRGTGQLASAPPEPSDATSAISQEEAGQGSPDGGGSGSRYPSTIPGISSNEPAKSQGYPNGGGGQDEAEWNVVRKVVDLVAHKRVPTLQVYVRALDSFFMSESIRNSLTREEREQIKQKLLMIVQGDPGRRSAANADHAPVSIDPSNKARTQLLAFSALVRLGSEGPDDRWRGGDLLRSLDSRLDQVQESFVIWSDEVLRYKELCEAYSHPHGQWLTSGKWKIRGEDLTQGSGKGRLFTWVKSLFKFKWAKSPFKCVGGGN